MEDTEKLLLDILKAMTRKDQERFVDEVIDRNRGYVARRLGRRAAKYGVSDVRGTLLQMVIGFNGEATPSASNAITRLINAMDRGPRAPGGGA